MCRRFLPCRGHALRAGLRDTRNGRYAGLSRKSQQVDVVAPFRRFPDSVPVTDGDTDGRPIVCDIAGGTGEKSHECRLSRFKQRFGLVLREQQVDKVERGYIGELFAVTASAQFGDKPLPGIDACGRDVVFPVVLRPQFQCARPTPPVNEEAHRAQPCEGCGASVGGNPPLYGFDMGVNGHLSHFRPTLDIDEAQDLKTLAAGYDTQILVIVELAAQGGFHFQRGVAVRTLAP